MAARLAWAFVLAFLAISVRADSWQCAGETDCYGCLSVDPSCYWCPSTRLCAANFVQCNVSTWEHWQADQCPCTDISRDDCESCLDGPNCGWCIDSGTSSNKCVVDSSPQCTTWLTSCPDIQGLAKWIIAVIVISSILVVLVPVVIVIICCCCVAGTAAAVSASERQSLVHQHNSSSSATVIYSQPGYAPPPGVAPTPYQQAYPQPSYQ